MCGVLGREDGVIVWEIELREYFALLVEDMQESLGKPRKRKIRGNLLWEIKSWHKDTKGINYLAQQETIFIYMVTILCPLSSDLTKNVLEFCQDMCVKPEVRMLNPQLL